MHDEADPENNVGRLLARLKEDSLAARIVGAYRESGEGAAAERLKTVLSERLEQVRAKLDAGGD